MARLFGELLFGLARSLVGDLIEQAILRMGTWLDTRLRGRRTKIVVGLLLGFAAYLLIPIIFGLLGL
jgi:hypothetical protein